MSEQLRKPKHEREEVPVEELAEQDAEQQADTRGAAEDTLSDIDDVLDEIDAVLEENAEEFVNSYIQKGGE